MGEIIDIKRGLTTNANDIFYIPSKYWKYSLDTKQTLVLKNEQKKIIKINKRYLKPLIRKSDVDGNNYEFSNFVKVKKEDYVLWVQNVEDVQDKGAKDYIDWAEKFIIETNQTEELFPSIAKKIENEQTYSNWAKLQDRSAVIFC